MLTEMQLEFARSHRAVDTHDTLDGIHTSIAHSPHGVYVIRQKDDEVVESYMIPYRLLAVMNSRDWPVKSAQGQRPIIFDGGNLKTMDKTPRTKHTDPGKPWKELVGFAPRTEDGFPKLSSQWRHVKDDKIYRTTGFNKAFRKRPRTINMQYIGSTRVRTLGIERFNHDFVPYKEKRS
tara:strand:- start:1786 stop:2319 length:534 start_codon:yes stop_codon:yes gene_type:complete